MGLSIQFYVWSLLCNVFLFSISKFELFSGTYITDFTVWFGLFKCKFDFRKENILSRKSTLYNESTLQFKNSYKTNDREQGSFSLLQKCTKNKLRLLKCVISSNWNRFRILNQQFVTENFLLFQTDIQHAQFTTDGSVSRLTYIAKTDLDYGTMTCLASNEVGESNKPCLFQIVRDGNFIFQTCTLVQKYLNGSLVRKQKSLQRIICKGLFEFQWKMLYHILKEETLRAKKLLVLLLILTGF